MDNSIFFSYLICVYNGEAFLKESLESIDNQCFRDFEVIIVNDGSTDSSIDIIKAFKKRCNKNVIVIDKENEGLTKSLNIGLKHCKGKYIVRQDADDLSLPNRLRLLHSELINGYDFICTKSFVFNDTKEFQLPKSYYNQKNAFSHKVLALGNIHIHGTFCISRKTLSLLKYDENYRYSQDFDLLLRLIKLNANLLYLPIATYKLRIQNESISKKHSKEQNACMNKILSSHFSQLQLLIAAPQKTWAILTSIIRAKFKNYFCISIRSALK